MVMGVIGSLFSMIILSILICSMIESLYVCKRRDQGTRLQTEGMAQCLRGKREAERQYTQESVMYKCWKGKAELEDNIDGSKSIKKLIIDVIKSTKKAFKRDRRYLSDCDKE